MTDDLLKQKYLLDILSGKWRLLIIQDLFTGTKQFKALQSDLKGITAKVLTENLMYLNHHGIINRKAYPIVPPKVEYSLTDRGWNIKPILQSIYQWGAENYYCPTPDEMKNMDLLIIFRDSDQK